eukprot:CAMPEP_0195131456 /NCGR_PEP_ID=MMETSP0448-20130528/145060_1 /TAXON_ID=66468 /ORGANISM="Heterocapsa triquestra, Strain CCMP 448" /LENGTH=65 /DNA_ID=CAMNT_0040169407 /DNA_START=69 /DNA_END=263 /DNA_ORIENTATION=+
MSRCGRRSWTWPNEVGFGAVSSSTSLLTDAMTNSHKFLRAFCLTQSAMWESRRSEALPNVEKKSG